MMDLDPGSTKNLIPAAGGGLTAALLLRGSLSLMLTVFFIGFIAAYFAGELAHYFGEISDRAATYLVGVCFPFVALKAKEVWESIDFTSFAKRFIGRFIGVSSRDDKDG